MTITSPTPAPLALSDRDGLAVIGRTLHDLRGIRFENEPGGAAPAPAPGTPAPTPGTPAPAPAPGAPTPPPAGTPIPQPTPGSPAPQPGQQQTPPQPAPTPGINPRTGQPYTPEETQAHISRLNSEAQTQRERAEAAETARLAAEQRANAILRAAGFNPDGTPYTEQTPEQVQAALQDRQSAADTAARENVVLRVSGSLEHRANADALLDSRDFGARLASISVTDRAGVEALVDEYVQKDGARFGVTSAAASSGGVPHTGTPSSTGARKSTKDALAERYGSAPRSPGTAAS